MGKKTRDYNKVYEDLMRYEVIDGNSIGNERELRKQIHKNDKWGKISEKLIKQLLLSDKFESPFREIEKIKDKKEQQEFRDKKNKIASKMGFYISVWNIKGKLMQRLRSKTTGRFIKIPSRLKNK